MQEYEPHSEYPEYNSYYCPPPQKKKRSGLLFLLIGLVILSSLISWAVRTPTREGKKEESMQAVESSFQITAPEVAQRDLPTKTSDTGQGSLIVEDSPESVENRPSADADALSLQEIYAKVSPSVVSISCSLHSGSSSGTGIIMSPEGYLITNYHVIENAQQIRVLLENEETYPAELVGGDETSDLAVLKIDANDLPAAEFGNSDVLRVGDTVVAIGDPLGAELRGTMTDGIVSAINRDLNLFGRKMTLIQTNAALNTGNSGGPLINCYGQVIGINTMKMSNYSPTSSAEGLGFAIPIAAAKPIVDELIARGYVSGRPAIGICGQELDLRAQLFYHLPSGVLVKEVLTESDAYEKGLRIDDMIVAINGTPVSSLEKLVQLKSDFTVGDTVQLTVYRGGIYYQVDIVLMDQIRSDIY